MVIKTKTIRNKSPVTQTVFNEGVEVSLAPFEEQLVDASLAQKFIDSCQGLVVEVEADFGAEYQDTETGRVWIANRTGNPDAKDVLSARIYDGKTRRWISHDIDNPIKAPRDLREYAQGAQEEYTAKDGVLEALNRTGHWVEIPAYRRRQLDKAEAEWFMTRVSNAAKAANIPGYDCSVAMVSRPPATFEPTMKWSLNDIRLYLRLVDPDANLGNTEEEISKELAENNVEEFEWARSLDDAKRVVMKKVYFRLIDPRYRLPTKAQFNELKATKKKRTKATNTEQPATSA